MAGSPVRKDSADEIKVECDNAGDYSRCLQYMSQESLDSYLDNLDFIESIFDKEVTDYAIDFTHDVVDDVTYGLVRVFWFSRGMEDFYLCIDGNGIIRSYGDDFPNQLLLRIVALVAEIHQVLD